MEGFTGHREHVWAAHVPGRWPDEPAEQTANHCEGESLGAATGRWINYLLRGCQLPRETGRNPGCLACFHMMF